MDQDEDLAWAPAPGNGPEVVYAVDGPLGRARLNRPRAINALDRASIDMDIAPFAAFVAERVRWSSVSTER